MEFQDIVVARRSTRKFSDKGVSKELITKMLDATLLAPSSRNSHSTKFMVVTSPQKIEALSIMRDYGSSFMKNAPCAIVVMGDTSATDLWEVNCAISATTLQLACVAEGLVSCWVHVQDRPQKQAEPEGAKAIELVREVLPIPEGHDVLCVIACGYSDFSPAPLPEFDKESKVLFVE
ncbi:MAG: nitroreductase family protein [Rikenellaceae bacterium]